MSRLRVCHLTNVHSPRDQRIYYKETLSLAAAGHEVFVIGPGPEALEGEHDGVRIVTVPKPVGFAGRLRNPIRLLRRGLALRADIYHFHDPELLPLGLLLRLAGKKVIYDCHEHYPQVAYIRRWVPALLKPVVSLCVDLLERLVARRLSGVLGVVDDQSTRFAHRPFAAVKNYPRLEWFAPNGNGHAGECELLHVGSLSRDRGSDFLLDVMRALGDRHPDVRLRTLGPFHSAVDEARFRGRLEAYGLVDRVVCQVDPVPYETLGELIQRHRIGLIPGQVSVKNMTPFIPTKLFEYLACGLPVVASDLPSIRAFYEAGDWGAIADPGNPAAHAEAIAELLEHPDEAAAKGRRGRALVEAQYNWSAEAEKLIAFYDCISDGIGKGHQERSASEHALH